MLKSMTGYGRSNFTDKNFNLDIELKSVNSRYLDINIKIPNQMNFLEEKILKFLRGKLSRGRIDLFIRSKSKNLGVTKIIVDEDAVIKTHKALCQIAEITNIEKNFSIEDLFINTDIISFESEELDEKFLEEVLLKHINIALESLINMRTLEGKNIYKDIIEKINLLEKCREDIIPFTLDIKENLYNKLYLNASEFLEDSRIDQDRLANEIVFYLDRADINEELSRLKSHFEQFKINLMSDNAVGKKLDFISQEILREINTISSKSNNIEIRNIIIEMKTIIEKIKEQVQNVE